MPTHLPRSVMRAAIRTAVRPLLRPAVPVAVQRAWLDAFSAGTPLPAGTRVERGRLADVRAVRVTVPSAGAEPAAGSAVLLLHGGGYTIGSPLTHRAMAAHIARAAAAPVYVLDYRLAPEHPFPAALDDALAAYRALAARTAPGRLLVAGDSAGGGLALALCLRLRAAGEDLPAGLGLISPWTDLTLTGASIAGNARRDALLPGPWIAACAERYRGAEPAQSPEVSPHFADLAGLPPLVVQVAGDELLLSDAERLAERARTARVEVRLTRFSGLWHDFQLHAGLLRDADEALTALGEELRGLAGGAAVG